MCGKHCQCPEHGKRRVPRGHVGTGKVKRRATSWWTAWELAKQFLVPLSQVSRNEQAHNFLLEIIQEARALALAKKTTGSQAADIKTEPGGTEDTVEPEQDLSKLEEDTLSLAMPPNVREQMFDQVLDLVSGAMQANEEFGDTAALQPPQLNISTSASSSSAPSSSSADGILNIFGEGANRGDEGHEGDEGQEGDERPRKHARRAIGGEEGHEGDEGQESREGQIWAGVWGWMDPPTPLEPLVARLDSHDPRGQHALDKDGSPCSHYKRTSPLLIDGSKHQGYPNPCTNTDDFSQMQEFMDLRHMAGYLSNPVRTRFAWASSAMSPIDEDFHDVGYWWRAELPQPIPDVSAEFNFETWRSSDGQYEKAIHSSSLYSFNTTIANGLQFGPEGKKDSAESMLSRWFAETSLSPPRAMQSTATSATVACIGRCGMNLLWLDSWQVGLASAR